MKGRGTFLWLISGVVFGAGLAWSGMINPRKVLAFLDVAGDWDPTLAFVMASALVVTWIGYRLASGRSQPFFGEFSAATARSVDAPLIIGASLFGIGWGLAGYCPGPVLAAFVVDWREPLIFTLAMSAGMYLRRLLPG